MYQQDRQVIIIKLGLQIAPILANATTLLTTFLLENYLNKHKITS